MNETTLKVLKTMRVQLRHKTTQVLPGITDQVQQHITSPAMSLVGSSGHQVIPTLKDVPGLYWASLVGSS